MYPYSSSMQENKTDQQATQAESTMKKQAAITVIKAICALFSVDVPTVWFADDVVRDDTCGEYGYEVGEVRLFSGWTLNTAAHEALHHVQYQTDWDRATFETAHGSQFQAIRNKARRNGIKVK